MLASWRVVACIASLGVAPVVRPVATADHRFRFPRWRALVDLAVFQEVFAAFSHVFRSDSHVADVEMVTFALVSHYAAISKVITIVTLFVASGGGGSQARPKVTCRRLTASWRCLVVTRVVRLRYAPCPALGGRWGSVSVTTTSRLVSRRLFSFRLGTQRSFCVLGREAVVRDERS